MAAVFLTAVFQESARAADGPGLSNTTYAAERVGDTLSITDPGKAVSAVSFHRGYLFVPLSQDHGGGMGDGAFAFYDFSDPKKPVNVFDSRNDKAEYHTFGTQNYVGDWAEMHHLSISDDLFIISERRNGSAGFCIFDSAPLYDNDPATKPKIISHFSYDGVTSSTDYDGYSFAPAWQGRRYLYAPTGAQGLYIIDTSDVTHPVQLNHLSRAALGNITLRAAWPIGNLLILAEADIESQFEARVYDISNPANPLQIGSFSGPAGYHGFIYGSSFYNAAYPIYRFDFKDPTHVSGTDLYPNQNPNFEEPEYGFGKDGFIYIGHSPGGTKWKLNENSVTPVARVNSGIDDDHGFINPLGNLLLLCSDHANNRRMVLGVPGTDRDVTPPEALFSSPANEAVNQSITSRVGICFSDYVDPQSVNSGTLQVRNIATNQVVAGTYSTMMTIVNFVPDAPLAADATYDVVLLAGGVKDQSGNAVAADIRVARFSTGNQLSDYKVALAPTSPVQVGSQASFSITVTKPEGLVLEHSWDFGDGTAATSFSQAVSANHSYQTAGNFTITVRTRISGQTYAPAVNGVQVAYRPIPSQKAVNHTTIAVDPSRAVVWNVNPDNDSVSEIDSDQLVRIREIPVGVHPTGLALGSNDQLWVVCKDSADLWQIDRASGNVLNHWPLPRSSAPHGIVADVAGGFVYVTLETLGQVLKISASDGHIVGNLQVGGTPRGLALDPSRSTLWVSRFISPDDGGRMVPVDLQTFAVKGEVVLPSIFEPDGLQNGRGLPNYVAAMAISPDLTQAYIPSKKDNIYRGLFRDGQPLTFDHTVRSMATNLDLTTGGVNPSKALDFDNSDFATAAVFSPLGNVAFVATNGTTTIFVVDAYQPSRTYTFLSGGLAPDGLAVNADGSRLYVHNFMDRSVTVFRSTVACGSVCGTAPQIAKIGTVVTEKLPAQILKGKQFFYSTVDPRMAQDGYMSCASCHAEGGQDGRVWDFTSLGEGLRNTISLNGHGQGQGLSHWSGNFDELQDFEGQIRTLARGSGLMTDAQFSEGTRSDPLGRTKAGVSSDLDALAAYLSSLTQSGVSPYRENDGSLSADAAAGKEIFRQENCASCHSGTGFTDSASFIRHDVGTLRGGSGYRLGKPLDGLDTPTLRGLWSSAPYLHDGSASTVRDVLVAKDLSGRHVNLFHRNSREIDQLTAYLLSIDDLETTAPVSPVGAPPQIQPSLTQPVALDLDRSFSMTLSASGVQGKVTWQAVALPPGLEIDPATGVIAGAPSITGSFTARISIRDEHGQSSTMQIPWLVTDSRAYRYVKLESLSAYGGPFTSIAEFTLLDIDGKPLDQRGFVATASTQETVGEMAPASFAIDGIPESFWHSQWYNATIPFPHILYIDLVTPQQFYGFTELARQDGSVNGHIKTYNVSRSKDGQTWEPLIVNGELADTRDLQTRMFPQPVQRRPFFGVQPSFSVPENSPTGTVVGKVVATNSDVDPTLTFHLGAGNAEGAFSIDAATGVIRVAGPVDYETTALYQLQVIITGDGAQPLSASLMVPVTVSNVIESNEEAVFVSLTGAGGIYEGRGDPALIDFNADPDHDGIPNAVELLLGTDPHVPNAQPPVRISQTTSGGQTYMTYAFDVAAGTRIRSRCYVSNDLITWRELTSAPVLAGSQNGLESYVITDDQAVSVSGTRFMRLQINSSDVSR